MTKVFTYSIYQKSLYNKKPIGTLISNLILMSYHLANGVIVFAYTIIFIHTKKLFFINYWCLINNIPV